MPATALSRSEPERRSVPIWMIVALVACVSAILFGGYLFFFRQDYALLYRDLRPAAAAAIVEELKKERVPHRLGNGGADILVPAANMDSVRLAVTGADLPTGLNGFELFDNSDMGLTDFAQKIKFQRALQGELTRTILLINGVADARVHLSLPEKSLFRSESASAKASVTLLTKTSEPLTKTEIEGIQQLIASAIPDLQSQDVVILNGGGEVVSAPPQPPTPPVVAADPPPVAENKDQTTEARLALLLQQALPETLFRLRMEKVEAAPQAVSLVGDSGASPEAAAALLESNPGQQASVPASARLQVTTDRTLSAKEEELVRSTIGGSELVPANTPLTFAQGLALEARVEAPPIATGPSLPSIAGKIAAPPAAALEISLPSSPTPDSSAILIAAGLIVAVAIGLAIAIGLFLARRPVRSHPTLALEDHSRFAERLKAGLAQEQETPHAA